MGKTSKKSAKDSAPVPSQASKTAKKEQTIKKADLPDSMFGPIQIPDPPEKDENYDSSKTKKHSKKSTGGLSGHVLVKQLLGTAPKASVVGQPELKLEDLDENLLRSRLEALDAELLNYKLKCKRYKDENEWYRQEIESSEKDTSEYVRYLMTKKDEKIATIDLLQDGKRKDMEIFAQKRTEREALNQIKIEELKSLAVELEIKLEAKQQEMMSLSDIISKRSRHEAEIIKIKQDMSDADRAHHERVNALERQLLETRIKLQREADLKIQEMENAAQEKASEYLQKHTAALEVENRKLEEELRKCIANTQILLKRKFLLEKENQRLERDQTIRRDLLQLRLEKVLNAKDMLQKEYMHHSSAVKLAKTGVLQQLATRYPSLQRDKLLPPTNELENSRAMLKNDASLEESSVGKKNSLSVQIPVKVQTSKNTVGLHDTVVSKPLTASGTKWEVSDDDDDEFLS